MPRDTGMCSAPMSSSTFRAFAEQRSARKLPDTVVMALTSSWPEPIANMMATASSMPGSVSKIMFLTTTTLFESKVRRRNTVYGQATRSLFGKDAVGPHEHLARSLLTKPNTLHILNQQILRRVGEVGGGVVAESAGFNRSGYVGHGLIVGFRHARCTVVAGKVFERNGPIPGPLFRDGQNELGR